jgi:hypothetical protein
MMWNALRAELIYFRPWMFGGLGIAVGVSALLVGLAYFVKGADDIPAFLPGMFPILAGMVVSFIALGLRSEERRARLLLAAPLTLRQLAGVMVLLPVCLVAAGLLGGALLLGLTSLMAGQFELGNLPVLARYAGQFLIYALMGPLVQEAVAARRQGRGRAGLAGWAGLVAALPLLISLYWLEARPALNVGAHLLVATLMVVPTLMLFQGRTDFTR